MPVFSLMTHSTINTMQLSRSACVYGRVYWLLASVSQRTLSRPADHLPDWSWRLSSPTHATAQCRPAATQTEADTHSSTEERMKHQKSDAQVLFSTSRDAQRRALLFPRSPLERSVKKKKRGLFLLTMNRDKKKRCEGIKEVLHMMARTVELILMLSGSQQAAVGSQLTGQQ